MLPNDRSDATVALELLQAGATAEQLAEMLEGVTRVLAGIESSPSGWRIAPQFAHILRSVEPALAHERLVRSRRVLRLACDVMRVAS